MSDGQRVPLAVLAPVHRDGHGAIIARCAVVRTAGRRPAARAPRTTIAAGLAVVIRHLLLHAVALGILVPLGPRRRPVARLAAGASQAARTWDAIFPRITAWTTLCPADGLVQTVNDRQQKSVLRRDLNHNVARITATASIAAAPRVAAGPSRPAVGAR